MREMQDFIHFILSFRKILPNSCPNRRHLGSDYPMTQANKETVKTFYPKIPERGFLTVEEILHSGEVSPELMKYYNTEMQTTLPDQIDQEKILIFDSNFESGNLDRVSIVSLSEYNLFLNVDTNTKGHSQWFYFAVTNTERNRTVVFNVLNCTNAVTLFKSGMRPLVFSELDYEEAGTEWVAETFNVCYTKNTIPKNPLQQPVTDPSKPENRNINTYYTLSFSYTFKYSGDRVYFAYTRPYSVSKHCGLLRYIQEELITRAKNITILEEDGLQKRIKQFLSEEEQKTNITTGASQSQSTNDGKKNKQQQEEDQFKMKEKRRKVYNLPGSFQKHNSTTHVPVPEFNIAAADVLRQYNESEGKYRKFNWIKGQDFQIDTEDMIYRQETLSHTFSGFPVELITITAQK